MRCVAPPCDLLLPVGILLAVVGVRCGGDQPYDYRTVSYQDLVQQEDVTVYSHPDISDYLQLNIDSPRKQLLVGARNYLVSLSLSELKEQSVVQWQPSSSSVQECLNKGQTPEDCNNYIKVLLVNKDRAFVCGTYAFDPSCSWRSAEDLSKEISSVSGKGKCPYNPHDNNTVLMTSDQSLFSGTVVDYTARDPVLYRSMGPLRPLRTLRHNSKWLNEPNFVSTYEIGEYIYFFFRETAVEYINCGKSVYSRVARVCKSDSGGNFLLEDNWTTFLKARLNCSLPGEFPFYFNELQSTHYDQKNQLVYAVFSTPRNSIGGSAVCVYKMAAFQKAFQGRFKYQEGPQSVWRSIPNVADTSCPNSQSAHMSLQMQAQKQLLDAQRYQMMNDAVQPLGGVPVTYQAGQSWSHIAVDMVPAKHHRVFSVMFVAGLDGTVRKLVRLSRNQTCLVETIQVVPGDKPQSISKMQLHAEEGALYIGTKTSIIKVPVQRCHRFRTRRRCEGAMDPYCGWDSNKRKCTARPSGPSHNWHQDITRCPDLTFPVDGGWSAWSRWELCKQVGQKDPTSHCKCRHRTCDSPRPQGGGDNCDGPAIEVTNCTTHGGWSDWSVWSTCSATCGIGHRFRTRGCNNPVPQFGGTLCRGESLEEQVCQTGLLCPGEVPAREEGVWHAWGQWSACTVTCGHGMQMRRRECQEPSRFNGGRPCIGNDNEWRQCHSSDCRVAPKRSRWTPWRVLNVTSQKIFQQRFRFTCALRQGALEVSRPEEQTRLCTSNKCGQKGSVPSPPDIDGRWSQWTDWTVCNAPCGGGRQQRRRYCNSPSPSGNGQDCTGHGVELRECNVHSCQGEWSCWTDFSQCSKSCGMGFQYRQRHCRATIPGKLYTKECTGNAYEKQNCHVMACQDENGWDPWTTWSLCSDQATQNRKRKCGVPYPRKDQCQGPSYESRICVEGADALAATGKRGPEIKIIHIVVVGIVSFVLGAIIAVGLFLYCQRRREERRHGNPDYSSLSKHRAQPNLYVSPSELNVPVPPVQLHGMNMNNKDKYYSTGSLSRYYKDNQKLTVREATLKRNSMMRTDLSLNEL